MGRHSLILIRCPFRRAGRLPLEKAMAVPNRIACNASVFLACSVAAGAIVEGGFDPRRRHARHSWWDTAGMRAALVVTTCTLSPAARPVAGRSGGTPWAHRPARRYERRRPGRMPLRTIVSTFRLLGGVTSPLPKWNTELYTAWLRISDAGHPRRHWEPAHCPWKSPPDVFLRMKTSRFRRCYAPVIASLRSNRRLIRSLLTP
jgi:hypothetical protein